MGGVAKNGTGAELLHPWVSETDYREESAERVGWEMVLPLTGGGHEGSRVHRRQDVHKQKSEHGCAVHCNATASGPLRGGDTARRGEGNNEMVGPEGNRLGEGKSEGRVDGIGVQIGYRHGRRVTRDAKNRGSGSSGAKLSVASADEW